MRDGTDQGCERWRKRGKGEIKTNIIKGIWQTSCSVSEVEVLPHFTEAEMEAQRGLATFCCHTANECRSWDLK